MTQLYKIVNTWNDGTEDWEADVAIVRAGDEVAARRLLTEKDKEHEWLEAGIEMVGWATGQEQEEEVLVIC